MSLTSGAQAYGAPVPSRVKATLPWESYKYLISTLYASNSLEHVMQIMKMEHGFKATENQYKKQIAKWGQDRKRVKGKEYMAILKHQRRMRREEPERRVDFFLHGKLVPASDIARFESRMLKQSKINEHDTFSNIETPLALTWKDSSSLGLENSHRYGSCLSPRHNLQTQLQGDTDKIDIAECLSEDPLPDLTATTWPASNHTLHDLNTSKQQLALPVMRQEVRTTHPFGNCISNNAPQQTVRIPIMDDVSGLLTPTSSFSQGQSPLLTSFTRTRTPPPRIPKTPSSSSFGWWPFYEEFSLSPTETFYSTAPRHDLEQLLRNFGKELQCHEEEQIYKKLLHESVSCQGYCNFCLFYQPTSAISGRCRLGRILTKLHSKQRSRKFSVERSCRLAAHALFRLLPDSNPSHLALFHYSYWFLAITRNPYLLDIMHGFFTAFVDPLPHARALVLSQLAYAFTIFLRYDESLAMIRRLFGTEYVEMMRLCDQYDMGSFSYAMATLSVTSGEVAADMCDDGYISYCPTKAHGASSKSQWYYERDGRLRVDEIQGRVEALYVICRIRRLQREAVQNAKSWHGGLEHNHSP